MALPFLLGGAAVGGLAGSMKDKSRSESGIRIRSASRLERRATRTLEDQLKQLGQITKLGAGGEDVTAGLESQRSLADLLQQMQASGGLPTGQDTAMANQFARQSFQSQRRALDVQNRNSRRDAARLAARLGTDPSDPILQARLAQQQQDAGLDLAARQGAFGAQFAQQLPGRRLGFASDRANVLQGLSDQAFNNRFRLSALGSQIQGAERKFRLDTGTRFQTKESGGGLKGALTGAIAGGGIGMGVARGLQNMNFIGALQKKMLDQGEGGGGTMTSGVGAKTVPAAASISSAVPGAPNPESMLFKNPTLSPVNNETFFGARQATGADFGTLNSDFTLRGF